MSNIILTRITRESKNKYILIIIKMNQFILYNLKCNKIRQMCNLPFPIYVVQIQNNGTIRICWKD